MRNSAEANNIRQMIITVVGEPDVHGAGCFEWQTSYLITTGLLILQLYTPVTHDYDTSNLGSLKMKNQLACEVFELPVLVGANLVIPIPE